MTLPAQSSPQQLPPTRHMPNAISRVPIPSVFRPSHLMVSIAQESLDVSLTLSTYLYLMAVLKLKEGTNKFIPTFYSKITERENINYSFVSLCMSARKKTVDTGQRFLLPPVVQQLA